MRQHKIFYGSSYDRGLMHLLLMWKEIKKEIPDATLDIYYGWKLFQSFYANNPERMKWKANMEKLMQQDGITEHGRVSKSELIKAQQECGIWAYPTHFEEINCITALACQKNGCVPCVINYAALKETVGSGVKVEGDIYEPAVRRKYVEELVSLMKDEKKWKEEQEKGYQFAKKYEWPQICQHWDEVFKET